jgi:hypothetical protein
MLLSQMEEESVKNIMKMNNDIDEIIKSLDDSRRKCLEIAEECICFFNNNLSLWKIYQTKDNQIYFAMISSREGLDNIVILKYSKYGYNKLELLASSALISNNLSEHLMRLDEFMPNLLYFKEQKYKFIYVSISDKKTEIQVYEYQNKVTYYEYDYKKCKFVKGITEYGCISISRIYTDWSGYYDGDYSGYDEEKFKYHYPGGSTLEKIVSYIEKYKKIV